MSTFVCICLDKSVIFDNSKKKSTLHRPAMSIVVLVSCCIQYEGIYSTEFSILYSPLYIKIYVKNISSNINIPATKRVNINEKLSA